MAGIDLEFIKSLRAKGAYYMEEPTNTNSNFHCVIKTMQMLWQDENMPIKGYKQEDILMIALGVFVSDWINWPDRERFFNAY